MDYVNEYKKLKRELQELSDEMLQVMDNIEGTIEMMVDDNLTVIHEEKGGDIFSMRSQAH